MTLNPQLSESLLPLPLRKELLILKGSGISFQILIDNMGTLKGNGDYVLSTDRVCLINKKGGAL